MAPQWFEKQVDLISLPYSHYISTNWFRRLLALRFKFASVEHVSSNGARLSPDFREVVASTRTSVMKIIPRSLPSFKMTDSSVVVVTSQFGYPAHQEKAMKDADVKVGIRFPFV